MPNIVLGSVRIAIHLLVGATILAIFFPFASRQRRERTIRWWSRKLLAICGVEPRVGGTNAVDSTSLHELCSSPFPRTMLVMNHISWIDIYIVHALRPARFVAKSEIRAWPLIGYLCDRTGTIFLERGKRHAVHQATRVVADVLIGGGLVAVFPEGTTTDVATLLPFHANLIQAAVDAGVPVRPAALRYFKRDDSGKERFTDAAAYVGETTMFESLQMILRRQPLVADLRLLGPIDTAGLTRHQIADRARRAIAEELELEIGSGPARNRGAGRGLGNEVSPGAALAGTALGTASGPRGEPP